MESKPYTDVPEKRFAPAPAALKAFAHPLRMALYAELGRNGSATASQLARALGESSGQTSYHLRQLERHGFIEDDPAHVGGRERWWRPVGFEVTDPAMLVDPETSGSARAVLESVIAERAATLSAWYSALKPEDAHTLGLISAASLNLTGEEAEQLTSELTAVIDGYSARARDRDISDSVRRFRVHLDVFPLAGADPS
jgi:Predicted transcriptional regulators